MNKQMLKNILSRFLNHPLLAIVVNSMAISPREAAMLVELEDKQSVN